MQASTIPAVQGVPAPPQAPPAARAPVATEGGLVIFPGGTSPRQIYDALRAQRSEIADQIRQVENARDNIAGELRNPGVQSTDKAGLQQRLAMYDQRLASLEIQKAEADAAVAKQAAVPGSIQRDPPRAQNGPPEEVFALIGVFMFVVVLPLTLAFARRIWRRGAPPTLPQEIYDRFTRVEQSLDTIAIEVERVGEGQRFLTRMQSQQAERALGAGAAERVEAGVREKARDAR